MVSNDVTLYPMYTWTMYHSLITHHDMKNREPQLPRPRTALRPRCYTIDTILSMVRRTDFSQFQASSATLGWPWVWVLHVTSRATQMAGRRRELFATTQLAHFQLSNGETSQPPILFHADFFDTCNSLVFRSGFVSHIPYKLHLVCNRKLMPCICCDVYILGIYMRICWQEHEQQITLHNKCEQ